MTMLLDASRSLRALAGLLAALAGAPALADCSGGGENPFVAATAPATEFAARGDGTILHLPTRLVWQRCALGQSWTGSDCEGSARMLSWQGALAAAQDHVQDGREDWRLPDRNELASILESRCHAPALNAVVFPGAPTEGFWTASPVAGQAGQAWIVGFGAGVLSPADVASLQAVRLVRSHRP